MTRLLVVDDSMVIRQMLAQQLATIGYTDIAKAVNGLDALSQMMDAADKRAAFDIVLLDWTMPSMNGYDFLVKCRADKRFAKTAIVMVTAEREEENMVKALEAGATSYLVKPYSSQALEDKMKHV